VARYAAVGKGRADLALVAVDLGRVDVAVAELEGVGDAVDRALALQAEGAGADDGHVHDAVLSVQR
jgi:hypothetical protein